MSQYTDGRAITAEVTFTDLNNLQVYFGEKAKRSKSGQVTKSYTSEGEPAGSQVKGDFKEGSINFTYALSTDEDPGSVKAIEIGHVLKYRSEWWLVTKNDADDTKGAAMAGSLSILRVENPVFEGLLSQEGDYKAFTKTVGTAWTTTQVATNTRAGATVTYALEGAPAGMTVAASTGVITWTTPVVGTYSFKIVATDALAGSSRDRVQAGNIKLTVS